MRHQFGAFGGVGSANNIQALRERRGWMRPELARRMDTSPQQVERLEKSQRKLSLDWIDKAAGALEVEPWQLIVPLNDAAAKLPPARAVSTATPSNDVDLVSIPMIDLAYGMGATYTDGHVEVDVLNFPKVWVETITYSPPELLTWARGRGDSMAPTIHDGDLVLLDRSQRRVTEQDALWAYTIGDMGAIKRLRLKGDRMVILSDNPNVPPDEEPIDTVNIVARVVFIGKRS